MTDTFRENSESHVTIITNCFYSHFVFIFNFIISFKKCTNLRMLTYFLIFMTLIYLGEIPDY